MLEDAKAGAAERDDAPALVARGVAARRGLGAERSPLAMHDMIRRIRRAHRQERASADVQCNEFGGDTAQLQRVEQRRSHVKAGGRRSNRAVIGGMDGLIIRLVTRIRAILAGDIGR